jgi:hypothetical protein
MHREVLGSRKTRKELVSCRRSAGAGATGGTKMMPSHSPGVRLWRSTDAYVPTKGSQHFQALSDLIVGPIDRLGAA